MNPITLPFSEDRDGNEVILKLYNTCYRLMKYQVTQITHEPQNADDLVHDAILRLIPKITLLRTLKPGQARVYAMHTAKAVAIDYMRRQSSIWTYYSEESGQAAGTFSPQDEFAQLEDDDSLHTLLGQLSERDRDMLYCLYRLEMEPKEIARLVGLNPSSIHKALSRARNRLCRLLCEKGWDDD